MDGATGSGVPEVLSLAVRPRLVAASQVQKRVENVSRSISRAWPRCDSQAAAVPPCVGLQQVLQRQWGYRTCSCHMLKAVEVEFSIILLSHVEEKRGQQLDQLAPARDPQAQLRFSKLAR